MAAAGSKRKRTRAAGSADPAMPDNSSTLATDVTAYDLEGLDPAAREFVEDNAPMESLLDPAKDAFDDATVRSIKAEALRQAGEYGIFPTEKEIQTALGLFPKVSLELRIDRPNQRSHS